jgi:hypothetical protein
MDHSDAKINKYAHNINILDIRYPRAAYNRRNSAYHFAESLRGLTRIA